MRRVPQRTPPPAQPVPRRVGAGGDVSEGTQALLDRPERLGDMRDRGLLTEEEAEAAKGPIVAELESRS